MTVVDFHNHFYPPEYFDALRRGGSAVRLTEDEEGNPVLHYPGDYNVAVRGHRDIEYRAAVMEREGVDLQVLSFTTPGVHVEEPERAAHLARLVNDAYAAIVRRYGDRFRALATLPLNDPPAAARELCRAMDELGLPGASLFSNVNGIPLADTRFEQLYAAADQRKAVLFIHPTSPVGVEAMEQFWLMPLVGFPFDTTLAAARLVMSGIAERYPGIRWVLAHLGGAIPYLAERLDRGWEAFRECRAHLSRRPSEVLREFWYDTVNFDPRALRLAADFAGAGRLLAGSDYPYAIGSITSMKASLEAMAVTEEDRACIRGRNALQLLGMA
ncbi:MAG TPA: amidohydrolase family protein [Gemmatimonadales bacterium]|nr:amidohydrolase family protein [Gemmatimonadales bacterium]